LSNDRDDAQGRSEATPSGRPAGEHPDEREARPGAGQPPTGASAWAPPPADQPYGQADTSRWQYGQNPYGAASYGQAPHGQAPYGQPAYGEPQYGQPPQGQPEYGQPAYGQPAYGQPDYGRPPYGQPGYAQQYGQPPYRQTQPARPGTVITAAVLGLVHGALGLLATVLFLAGGAIIDDLIGVVEETDPTVNAGDLSTQVDSVRAVLVVVALLALAWTVVMVWGSVLALRGRSRVLLLVGASIAVAATGLVFLFGLIGLASDPGADGQVGGVTFLLVFFLASLAMLVLLCLRSAGQYFAAHRQRRALALR
jgi:hypothetical protein